MRILRAADRVATPWKNGGGVTREVAVWPPGARMDDFDWRLSLADVAADGPFSVFPGIDRVLTVIEGDGLMLDVDGAATRLEPVTPFAFPGEAAVVARLTAGPIRDFNVMVRRDAWRAEVTAWRGGRFAASPDGLRLVLLLEGVTAQGADAPLTLSPLDVVLLEPAASEIVEFPLEAKALSVTLSVYLPNIG